LGISIVSPKIKTIKTEINLRLSPGIFVILTIDDKNKVKKVKLAINPSIIPQGLDFDSLPPTLEDNTIGSTGRIQGDKIVTRPATNANTRSRIIINLTSKP
jgi:hypothetical protein